MKYWIPFSLLIVALFAAVAVQEGRVSYQKEDPAQAEIELPDQKPVLFVGDIMLGRYVESLASKESNPDRSFENVAELLRQHVTIANLEGPIPDIHRPTPVNGFSFSFPEGTHELLKENGIAAVSLANNHMFDQGRSGWEETKRALDEAGVAHFGGYVPTEGDYFETPLGTTTLVVYGITMIATGWDEEQALAVTEKLRREHPGTYLVAFLHWGNEYVTQNEHQRNFAQKLIDRGADAIIGAHPHVIQGIELYEGKPILYSLGNFIFDQYWRSDLEDGLAIRLSAGKDSYRYEVIPIHSKRSVPAIADGAKRQEILQKLSNQSDDTLQESILRGEFMIPF
jgi:poly-gamma-glutamate capsule biosynthesis protein CapA/YwtB (metallophosphatase superfamily)